jgi:hypothetical protein
MVKYECPNCFNIYEHKGNYEKHMNKKKLCNPSSSITNPIPVISNPPTSIIKENINESQCCCCLKIFSNKNNRIKHEKTTKCFYDKIKEDEEKENANIEKIKQLEEIIADLKSKQLSTINSTINNTNNNTNNTTNYIQNIVINKHGYEDMSHLTDNQKIINLSKGYNSVPDYVLLKFFDPKHPENSNIFRGSLKSSEVYIFNGEKWIIDNLHDAVYNLNDNITSEIKDNYKELKHKLPPKVKELYEHTLNNDNELVAKTQNKMIEQMLYNERDIPLKIKKANKTNKRLI